VANLTYSFFLLCNKNRYKTVQLRIRVNQDAHFIDASILPAISMRCAIAKAICACPDWLSSDPADRLFQRSYQKKLLPGLVGPELSTPMCPITIWTSRCKVSDRHPAWRQWKRSDAVRRGHTRHESVWNGTILTHAALEFMAKSLLEHFLSRLGDIWAFQLSPFRQPGYVKVKFGDHDDYWHCCHGKTRIGLDISDSCLCFDST